MFLTAHSSVLPTFTSKTSTHSLGSSLFIHTENFLGTNANVIASKVGH